MAGVEAGAGAAAGAAAGAEQVWAGPERPFAEATLAVIIRDLIVDNNIGV